MTNLEAAYQDLRDSANYRLGYGHGDGQYTGPTQHAIDELELYKDDPCALVRWIFAHHKFYWEMDNDRQRWGTFRECAWLDFRQRCEGYGHERVGYTERLRTFFEA